MCIFYKYIVTINQFFILYIIYSDNQIYLVFNTAWTPCINFCKKISRIFNLRLTLEYDEISQDFCGKIEFNGTNLIKEEYYTYWEGMYKINNDFFWDNIDKIPEKERYKL